VAARPTWKGYLKLSLVSIPVKAFPVADGSQRDIQLNQLHEDCHNRIRYKKTCPIHGEVSSDEIVSGFEVAKDQYVPIDQEELRAIRPQNEQSIEIDTFIPENKLDDRFLTERSYFLVPDGKIAQKPYALVRKTLEEGQLRAIAEVILSNREQHVVVRPLGKLLMMTVLQHQQELKKPETFENEVTDVEVTKPEMQLTKQLVDGLTREKWSFEEYVDDYQLRLSELIAAKVEGKKLVKSPETDAPTIINLMDALKASIKKIPGAVASAKKSAAKPAVRAAAEATTKPRHKVAANKSRSTSKTKPASRKTG